MDTTVIVYGHLSFTYIFFNVNNHQGNNIVLFITCEQIAEES